MRRTDEKSGFPVWSSLCLLGLIGLIVLASISVIGRRASGTFTSVMPPAQSPTIDPPSAPEKGPPPASIGVATMEEDGTIEMILNVGTTQFSYPPVHEEYKNILKHLGGLKKGETKPVPPFPDSR